MNYEPVPLDFRPSNEKEFELALLDPMWRLCSGQLYKIMLKERDDDEGGMVVPFRPNSMQSKFLDAIWYRNIVCKARQQGYTTLISMMWLDHALFVADQRCGMVAQTEKHAMGFFRDKVVFAYNNLPPELKARMPVAKQTVDELFFAHNNSSIQVATSLRSGFIHRLHVSEYGKICQAFPEKAAEIVNGSLPSVPNDGIVVIESSAEGREGDFYIKVQQALAIQERGVALTPKHYRLHFCAWWENPDYALEEGYVDITQKDVEYFQAVEAECEMSLNEAQRRWYIATRDGDFSGQEESMWRQYPSTIAEPFQVSTGGKWYAKQLSILRKKGRIAAVPPVDGLPVHTCWDIGGGDGTAVWMFQYVGTEYHFIGFEEGWDEPYNFYIVKLQQYGYVWGDHLLPHDAGQKRQTGHRMLAAIDSLRALALGGRWRLVPKVTDLTVGINETRSILGQCRFDVNACKDGLRHLELYSKIWNERASDWSNAPNKTNGHSEAADAIRQFAQFRARERLLGRDGGDTTAPPAPAGVVNNVFRDVSTGGGWMSN
jgi:hypothetical protein